MFVDSLSLQVARSFRDLDAARARQHAREVDEPATESSVTGPHAEGTLRRLAWHTAIRIRSMTAPSG
jgi:hypothetical protein